MNTRDYDYVEARLLAPAGEASEALTRLRQCGYKEEATELLKALADFHDQCRKIRAQIHEHFLKERGR